MTEVASARDVIATADVEFLHGVPVHPGLAGADAILAALSEAGYAVVPRAATEAMCRAGESCDGSSGFGPWLDGDYEPENVELIWRAMIQSAEEGETR